MIASYLAFKSLLRLCLVVWYFLLSVLLVVFAFLGKEACKTLNLSAWPKPQACTHPKEGITCNILSQWKENKPFIAIHRIGKHQCYFCDLSLTDFYTPARKREVPNPVTSIYQWINGESPWQHEVPPIQHPLGEG